jgi:cytochrome P450
MQLVLILFVQLLEQYGSPLMSTLQTLSSVKSFFLAMAMYPEVQRKAQAEIDSVVGNDRMPNFDDYESLPYVTAIMKEVLRWQVCIHPTLKFFR